MEQLLKIMSLLRDPQHGCPWDLEQTPKSLTRYTLEEVYEVVDAVEDGSVDSLRDELGDLLFQVVFYARLAEESGQFDFEDVAAGISEKLLRRHPHVFPDGNIESFGQQQELDADQVVTNWEAIKGEERRQRHDAGAAENTRSVLDDIPRALPALERSHKLQKRAAGLGFDWQNLAPVLAKVKEELGELEEAIGTGSDEAVVHEVGDILFAVVNLARHLRVDPETALRESNRRFARRFGFIESQLRKESLEPGKTDLEKLDRLWNAAKQAGL